MIDVYRMVLSISLYSSEVSHSQKPYGQILAEDAWNFSGKNGFSPFRNSGIEELFIYLKFVDVIDCSQFSPKLF